MADPFVSSRSVLNAIFVVGGLRGRLYNADVATFGAMLWIDRVGRRFVDFACSGTCHAGTPSEVAITMSCSGVRHQAFRNGKSIRRTR